MKSFIPWFCLAAATTGSQLLHADGLDAYRKGYYAEAAGELPTRSGQDPVADYYLGRMRLYGYGQLKNNSLANRHFTLSAEKGFLPAQLFLANYNLIKENNPEKAFYWFKKAADAGNLKAQMYCAAAYLFGYGVKKNPDAARKYYIEGAKAGDAIAQYNLAMEFLYSRHGTNKKLGLIWLTKAADRENPGALLKLSEFYATGNQVAKDPDKAHALLEKSASQGYVPAMIALADAFKKQGDLLSAQEWLNKAVSTKDSRAELALGRFYADRNTNLYNPKQGFLWILKAAQNNLTEAQQDLATMYKEGHGVEPDLNVAAQWAEKAKAKPAAGDAAKEAVRWLTNDKATSFINSPYYAEGIFNAWQNKTALKENNYNQTPQMATVNRAELYKPKFVMVKPGEVAINEYFDILAPLISAGQFAQRRFPHYELDKGIETLLHDSSFAVRRAPPPSLVEADLPASPEKEFSALDYLGQLTAGWEIKAGYQTILNRLYGQAILGDSGSQFELGQLYQYGIAVAKNPQQAIIYYQLAAAQQDLRAEYNLGLLYLEGQTNPVDYKKGMEWLTDAAFKGNALAQYVLADIYQHGFTSASGEEIIKPDEEQAMSMYYLSAANHYGPAQYHLAEYLIKLKNSSLSVAAKQKRNELIKRLYEGAASQGIAEAVLPLAYYNAMSDHSELQAHAFNVARKEAKTGNSEAALLLGLMYDRGISVPANPTEALYWYQQAAINPVNAFILGTYYSEGLGVSKNLEKGRALLQQSADSGFPYANLNLSILKHNGKEDFLPELEKAVEAGNSKAGILLADYYLADALDAAKIEQAKAIYQRFADKGDKEGQLKLAFLYDQGLGTARNDDLAAKWYSASAEQGQPIAQYLLGQFYQLGRIGKQPNYDEAKKWYGQSQISYPKSSIALGFIYDTVDDNYKKAFENYKLAADNSKAIGQFNLGLMVEFGKGQPVDFVKAREMYTQAANQGYPKAMVQLAGLYFKGLGGSRDVEQAMHWYQKAAALDDRDALYELGLFAETGVSMPLSFAKAIQYYQQAAAKGNEKAKLALARMYQYGLGVEKNEQEAKKLYDELSLNNNAYAQYQLALMQNKSLTGTEPLSLEARKLMELASANGSWQARKMLQLFDAKQKLQYSFIEPINFGSSPTIAGEPADLMYLQALNIWNSGDELLSRKILNRLITQFPDYLPAKHAYQQLKQG